MVWIELGEFTDFGQRNNVRFDVDVPLVIGQQVSAASDPVEVLPRVGQLSCCGESLLEVLGSVQLEWWCAHQASPRCRRSVCFQALPAKRGAVIYSSDGIRLTAQRSSISSGGIVGSRPKSAPLW